MGTLTARRDGPLLTLALAHAGKANAIDGEMLAALDRAVAEVEADAGVRVVVLRGSPGGPFSTGADIGAWGPMSPEAFGRDWIAHGNRIFRRFERLRCPTVAAIEGACLGGGLELALCADLRVGSDAARLRFPEVGLGAMPGWEGGPRLARIAGRGRALEAVLTAREIDAETAARWGVLNAVWPAARFAAGLADLVATLAAVSPRAAAAAKAAIVGDDGGAAFHAAAAAALKASPDAETGLAAFRARRPAVF